MAYDYQIRPALNKAGYSDTDIGWDQGRKVVTLKGQDFIGKDNLTNVAGSTFTDRQTFDNALKKYNQGQQQQNLQSVVTNHQMPTNPYNQQLDDQIKYLMSFAQQNQQPVNPYSTAQYAAYKGQSDRRAQEGTRAAQEALGSAGFGRSTTLGERAQGIQNQEAQFLETQIIPQILAAEEAKRQQQFSNMSSLLDPLMNQRNYADNRAQTERGNAFDALSYLLGEDQRRIDNDRADRDFDRGVLESDRNFEYTQARDQIADERYKVEFDEDVRRHGLDYAMRKAQLNNQIANSNADNSRQNQSQAFNQFMKLWETQGVAPYDFQVNGQTIQKGTPLPQQQEQPNYRGMTASQVLDNIRNNYTSETFDEIGNSTGKSMTSDPNRRYQMFLDVIDSSLPTDTETNQVLTGLGLTKSEIEKFKKQALGQ